MYTTPEQDRCISRGSSANAFVGKLGGNGGIGHSTPSQPRTAYSSIRAYNTVIRSRRWIQTVDLFPSPTTTTTT
jgi:hypothetical protein